MTYSGNSTAGADQGQDIPDYDAEGWECPHCDHVFWTASAWSINDGEIGGVLCPSCSEFIADDELGIDEGERN